MAVLRTSVCLVLLLTLLAWPQFSCDRPSDAPAARASGDPIDWSSEPNPFAQGGDRVSFRALMREIDHHYLQMLGGVDELAFDPAGKTAYETIEERANSILAVTARNQFRYPEAPSSGLFAERRADLVGALEGLKEAALKRDAKRVRSERDRVSRACDLCHGSVRQATHIQPLMRYLEGLIDRSQRLLKAMEDPARREESTFRRFAEVGSEFEQIARADALLRYRPDDAYRVLCERFERSARALTQAARAQDRTALERAFLEVSVGSCLPCHDRFVK